MRRIIIVVAAALILTGSFIFTTRNMAASLAAVDAPETGPVENPEIRETGIINAEISTDWLQTVQENIRLSEYWATWQDQTHLEDVSAAFHAPNRAQNLRTYFTSDGIRILRRTDSASAWELGITLTGYGTADRINPTASAELQASRNRISYQRDSFVEWYLNGEKSLEQGFTLSRPPSPSWQGEDLILELAYNSDLIPSIQGDGSAVIFSNDAGRNVLSYNGISAFDANGEALSTNLQLVNADSETGTILLSVEAAGAAFPITVARTIESLTATYSWLEEGDQADSNFGISVSTAGNVDGDAYDDVIVGASTYDNGEEDEGRAYVYLGSASGLLTTPDWVMDGDQAGANFGISVSTAGNVNGDAYDDVIVGASLFDAPLEDAGRVFVYHGSGTGLMTTEAFSASGLVESASFGEAVGTAGDVNNDTYDDIIVGAPNYDTLGYGRAYVYHGSGSGLNPTFNWIMEEEEEYVFGFGISVGTAGDINGDTYDDVVIGASYSLDVLGGMAFVYNGSSSGLGSVSSWSSGLDQMLADYGASVSTAGDVNNDSYSDIIVGAPSFDTDIVSDTGKAYAYYGSASGLSTTEDWSVEGDIEAAGLGNSVSAAGEVNGDGYDDVVIGADIYNNTGRAYLYQGSQSGLENSAAWMASGEASYNNFGISVSNAGDVNGDGLSDVIVGASGYIINDTDIVGAAFVYHGEPDLVAESDSPTVLGESTTLSATLSVSGAFTYEWNFGDGSSNSSGQVVQYIYPAVGMYTAVVTATSGTTVLTDTTDVSIEISIADLTAENDSPTALGQATALSATITAGTAVNYEWDFDDGSTASGANVAHIYTAVGIYTATVTATNGISSDSTTTTVTVDETIAGISADNDSPTVLGDTTSFSVITTAGSNLTYEWDFGDGSPTESGRVITHTYAAIGSYTATVTGTNSVSSDSTTTPVTIEEAIAGLNAENDSPTALGGTTTLTGTITAGTDVTYEWDFGDGSPTESGQTATHDYGAVGLYTAILTATNQVGSDTTKTSVTIDETIAGLSADNDSPTSLGDTTNLTATITDGSNVTYEWDFGDGSPTETGKVVAHAYAAVGNYTATVTGTNSISSDTTTTEVTIDDKISGLSAVNDGPTVLGESTTLIASITGGSGVTYEWNFGDGSSTESGKTVTHEYPTIGSFTATVTATNSVGNSTANTTVIVDQIISGLSAENDGPTTLGETTTLTATITAGSNASYEWDFGDGSPKESGAVVTHDYDAVDGYTAIVTATNSVSSQTTTTVVTVQDIPIEGLIAGNNSPTLVGETTTFNASVSSGSNVTYEWDFGDGSPTETGATVTHVYSSADTYIAKVTAKNGVSSQNKTTIVVIYPYQNYLPIIYYEK